jgi:CRP/FNR family transcriptional regulator, cyclic AMP receptor protein
MTQTDSLVSRIDATWFGAGLPPASQQRLADIAREYEAPARTRLLREGDETRELGILVSGRVALTELIPGRGPVTLLTVEPDDIFGWSAVIPPFRSSASVTALEPIRVIAFDGPRLRAALLEDHSLAAGVYQQILEAVARRLRATRHQLLDLYGSEPTEPW